MQNTHLSLVKTLCPEHLASPLGNNLFSIRHFCRELSFESWRRKWWPVKAKAWGQSFPKWRDVYLFSWELQNSDLFPGMDSKLCLHRSLCLLIFHLLCLDLSHLLIINGSYLPLTLRVWNHSFVWALLSSPILVITASINAVFNIHHILRIYHVPGTLTGPLNSWSSSFQQPCKIIFIIPIVQMRKFRAICVIYLSLQS